MKTTLLILVLSIPALACLADDCADTVVIDSVAYPLPEIWCGRAVDSTLWADPSTLVKLPDELTFEDYRIYVTRETRDALVKMAAAAAKDSVFIETDSGYRSPGFQRRIIKRRLAQGDSIAKVFTSAAPPGYSEHHTGRALDLVPSEARFAHTGTYAWLQENAQRFGFYETYPEDPGSDIPWESWHWCYRSAE